jgi:hypothetical protein
MVAAGEEKVLAAKADDSSFSKRRLFPGKRHLFEQTQEDLVEEIVRGYKESSRPRQALAQQTLERKKDAEVPNMRNPDLLGEIDRETARTESSMTWAGIGLHSRLELSTKHSLSRFSAENELRKSSS